MRKLLAAFLIIVLGLGAGLLAGCGDKTKTVTDTGSDGQATVKTVADVKAAKTKFVLHMGLAYGAFRRYIQKPYQSGAFKQGAPKRKRTIVKAGLAAAFAYHELKSARRAAESSDVLRRRMLNPFDKVLSQMDKAVADLKSGKVPGDLGSLIGGLGGLKGIASDSGFGFKEIQKAVPGI